MGVSHYYSVSVSHTAKTKARVHQCAEILAISAAGFEIQVSNLYNSHK